MDLQYLVPLLLNLFHMTVSRLPFKSRLRWVTILVTLVVQFTAVMANGSGRCHSTHLSNQAIYGVQNFPQSSAWLGDGGFSLLYSQWASGAANQVVRMFRNQSKSKEVLSSLARSRAELAQLMADKNHHFFGRTRFQENVMTGIGSYSRPNANTLFQSLQKVIRAKVEKTGEKVETGLMLINEYKSFHLPRGISATALIFESSDYGRYDYVTKLVHPSPEDASLIFKDVQLRIDRLVTHPKTPEENLREFSEIMYGFYNAMPYERGSSAIGRSFFAGLYYQVFKRPIPELPDGVDMFAMILDQNEFVPKIEKFLR